MWAKKKPTYSRGGQLVPIIVCFRGKAKAAKRHLLLLQNPCWQVHLRMVYDLCELDGPECAPHALQREVEVGNVEYKLKLISPSAVRFEQLVTQLQYRIAEGGGRAIYEIGVADDGSMTGLDASELQCSLGTLQKMCAHIGAQMSLHRQSRTSIFPPG